MRDIKFATGGVSRPALEFPPLSKMKCASPFYGSHVHGLGFVSAVLKGKAAVSRGRERREERLGVVEGGGNRLPITFH